MLSALLTSKLARYGVALALVAALLVGIYAKGHAAGVRAEQGRTATEHAARLAAEAQQATLADQLRQQNAAVDDATERAQAKQREADQLAAALAKAQAAAAKDDARWRSKLDAATAKPECRALQEDLCDSVLDY